MKVLHLLGELRASGAEVMLREGIPTFRELHVEPVILSTGEVVGDYAAEFAAQGVRVVHVRFARSVDFAIGLLRLLRRERPEVVHVHTERANGAVCGLARLSGARVVRTVHSVFPYTGSLRVVRSLERAALRVLGVRHIAIGRAVQENEWNRMRNHTVIVDNWIANRFRPPTAAERSEARTMLGVPERAYAIASVGNCSPVKNHSAILSALPQVANVTGRQVFYLHVGSGQEEDDEKAVARSLETPVAVRFLGTLQDVLPILWASDVFCMPSLYEGVGIAALEALASGVPVVLSDVDGMRDVHAEVPSVRFEPPTANGVVCGVTDLQALGQRALREGAKHVAEEVRVRRCARSRIRELVDVYRGE